MSAKSPKTAHSVRYVRYPVRYPVRYQTRMPIGLCGMCGIPRYVTRECANAVNPTSQKRAYAYSIPHIPHIPHTPYESTTYKKVIPHIHTAHTAHPSPIETFEEKAVIRCNAENAGEVRALVRRWPELNALVESLQEQGVFPGLRALQITLTGSAEQVAKGLAGGLPENAPQAPQSKGAA